MNKIIRIIALIFVVASLCGCAKSFDEVEPTMEPTNIQIETVAVTEPIEETEATEVAETTEAPEEVKWEIPEENYVIDITHAATTDHELVAWCIYTEGGSDSVCDDCRRRIGDTVLNLVECKITNTGNDYYWPDTIRGVISGGGINPYQNMGHSTRWPDTAHKEYERHAVERAYRIAYEILTGNHSEIYRKGYFYYAGANAYGHEPETAIYCECGIYFMRQRGWDNSKFEQDWVLTY